MYSRKLLKFEWNRNDMLLRFFSSNDFMIKFSKFLSMPTLYIKEVCSVGLVLNIESNNVSISDFISFNDPNYKLRFNTIERKDSSSITLICKALRMFDEEGKFL